MVSSPQLTVLQTECFDVFHYFSWSYQINSMVHKCLDVTKLCSFSDKL